MNPFRFKQVSIVPQYAMSAMNPTRKIGKMIAELLALQRREVRGRPARARAPSRPGRAVSRDVLTMYPIELSGGMKQRMVMVLSTLLDPSLLIADEVTSALDVSTPEGRRRDAGRVPASAGSSRA